MVPSEFILIIFIFLLAVGDEDVVIISFDKTRHIPI